MRRHRDRQVGEAEGELQTGRKLGSRSDLHPIPPVMVSGVHAERLPAYEKLNGRREGKASNHALGPPPSCHCESRRFPMGRSDLHVRGLNNS